MLDLNTRASLWQVSPSPRGRCPEGCRCVCRHGAPDLARVRV